MKVTAMLFLTLLLSMPLRAADIENGDDLHFDMPTPLDRALYRMSRQRRLHA